MARHLPEHTNGDTFALALGWLSIGIGLAEIFAPERVCRLIGIAPTRRTAGTLRGFGAREIGNGIAILQRPGAAAPVWARVAGDALDIAALTSALGSSGTSRGRALASLAALGGLALADARCALDLGRADDERPARPARDVRVNTAITVDRPIQDVYRFWRGFETFPGFMRYLDSVQRIDDRRSRWTLRGPGGVPLEWEAEIVTDEADHMISWRSLPGSEIDHWGAVRFEHAPGGRGTELHVELTYQPPAGAIGRALAWLFGKDPRQQVREDLRRVKQMLEIGEVLMSDGPGLWEPARPHASAQAAKDLAGVRS